MDDQVHKRMEELSQVLVDYLLHDISTRSLLFLLLLPRVSLRTRSAQLSHLLHQHIPVAVPCLHRRKGGSLDQDRLPFKEEPVRAVSEVGCQIYRTIRPHLLFLHPLPIHIRKLDMRFLLLAGSACQGLQGGVLPVGHHSHD